MSRGDARSGRDSCGMIRALAQPATYLGLVSLVFIYCTLTYLLISDRRGALEDAVLRGGNIAQILDRSLSHVFNSADADLGFLRKSYAQNPETFDLVNSAHDPSVQNELTIQYVIVKADGRIASSSFSNAVVGTDVGDPEYFRFHSGSTTDELFVGKPTVSEYAGRRVIVLSRRIPAPDGKFAGVIAAFVDLTQIARLISPLDLGKAGSVALTGFDGVIRGRAINGTFDWDAIGHQIPKTSGIFDKLKNSSSGYYWNKGSTIDGIKRLISYHALDSLPLVVIVAISENEVYRRADENARMYWSITALLTIATFIGIWLGARRERRLIEATSEMKQAQEALQRGQERYTQVEHAVNDGIWDRNLLTGEGFYSPRWKTMLGYPDHGPPDGTSAWLELMHPDDRAAVAEAVRAHVEDGVPYKMEYRLLRQDGSYCWVQSRGKAIRDAAGRAVRLVGTITDITERKQAEALIAESRNNLERAERMALLGHHKICTASNQLTWSDGVYRIFGKSAASFTPTLQTTLELVHPDDVPVLLKYRRDAMEGRENPPVTLRAFRDDGRTIYVENWLVPIRAGDGTVTGVFGTVQDVTVREQTKEALARANHELETRVAERTAELAQEMHRREEAQMTLAQMQKMEAVGQLTAGIAHDFNNLLAVIRGSLEFVERAAADGLTAEPELIDAAVRAARRGTELVRRLLAFSRQSPLRAEPTIIDQLVLDTLRLLQRTLGANVDIVMRLKATGATVLVDRNQLANALVNLALNARDAMPDGGQLTIATTCQRAPSAAAEGSDRWPTGEEVCIVISDTGTGMTEEICHRAFEPFFTTKTDGLGTGLGLSMVHGFVEQSGGHIDIDSAVGRGTTVTIRLPRVACAGRADEVEVIEAASTPGREKTVLLVEDDADVRIVTAAQLKQLGYTVHAVATGAEAIDLIESPARIDITLTDIVLPGGVDGVTLVKEALRARPNMGLLCMSGYDPIQKHHRWLKIQNIEFLEKPFSSHRLAEALEALSL
jgi:PAS domain S-box-containing protein